MPRFKKTNNSNLTRPRKSGARKNRRRLEQRRRLIALGVDEEKVNTMTSREVLTMLKYPKKIASDK